MLRSFQYSNTPLPQDSITPALQYCISDSLRFFLTIRLASRRGIRTIGGLHGNDSLVRAS